jgi:putative transposase
VGQRRHGKLLLVAENRTGRIGRKVYRTRDAARADVFDYIERFYNTIRRHSTNGYLSPVEFERKVGLA